MEDKDDYFFYYHTIMDVLTLIKDYGQTRVMFDIYQRLHNEEWQLSKKIVTDDCPLEDVPF